MHLEACKSGDLLLCISVQLLMAGAQGAVLAGEVLVHAPHMRLSNDVSHIVISGSLPHILRDLPWPSKQQQKCSTRDRVRVVP